MTVPRALRDLLDEWDERAASPEAEGLTARPYRSGYTGDTRSGVGS